MIEVWREMNDFIAMKNLYKECGQVVLYEDKQSKRILYLGINEILPFRDEKILGK